MRIDNSMARVREQIRLIILREQRRLLREGKVPRENRELIDTEELRATPEEDRSPRLVYSTPIGKLLGLIPSWMRSHK